MRNAILRNHLKNPLGVIEDFHCKAFPHYIFVIKHFQSEKLKYCKMLRLLDGINALFLCCCYILLGARPEDVIKFTDDRVCKSFLMGLCPHELFNNTVSKLFCMIINTESVQM